MSSNTSPRKPEGDLTIAQLIKAIQKTLAPDLLKPQFREGNKTNPMFGHCYHSAEALYHLIRKLNFPKEYLSYRPCRGVDGKDIAHWWLQNHQGEILDPTAGQYSSKNLMPPYKNGRFRFFRTKQASKKAVKLIIRTLETGKFID